MSFDIAAAWSVIPVAGEKRNIIASGGTAKTVAVQAEFDEGYAASCQADASNTSTFMPMPLPDTTIADGETWSFIGTFSYDAWTPTSATDALQIIAGVQDQRIGHQNASAPGFFLCMNTSKQLYVAMMQVGIVSFTYSSALYTVPAPATQVVYRVDIARSGSQYTLTLYIWESGAWVSTGSVSASGFTAHTIRGSVLGVHFVGSKGFAGAINFSRLIWGKQNGHVAAGTMKMNSYALPNAPDGTPDEWTPDTGTDAYARINDALGSESTASYAESASTTAQKEQEINFAAISPSPSGTIRGVAVFAGCTAPASMVGVAYLRIKSGASTSELDAYFADSGYGSGSASDGGDVGRFWETNPSGSAWTEADINAATVIWKKASGGSAYNWRVHSAILQVLYGDIISLTPPPPTAEPRSFDTSGARGRVVRRPGYDPIEQWRARSYGRRLTDLRERTERLTRGHRRQACHRRRGKVRA